MKIHCSNHRIELAVKDAFKGTPFNKVDEFYQAVFKLLRRSGKLKIMVEAAATALGIEHSVLPRLTGTRFVGHRVRALKSQLDTWPSFISAFENCLADSNCKKIHGKVKGLWDKFHSYRVLCLACTYRDVLLKMRPASKVFEGDGLLVHEIKPTIILIIDFTLFELADCKESAGTDSEYLDSNLAKFALKAAEYGNAWLIYIEIKEKSK